MGVEILLREPSIATLIAFEDELYAMTRTLVSEAYQILYDAARDQQHFCELVSGSYLGSRKNLREDSQLYAERLGLNFSVHSLGSQDPRIPTDYGEIISKIYEVPTPTSDWHRIDGHTERGSTRYDCKLRVFGSEGTKRLYVSSMSSQSQGEMFVELELSIHFYWALGTTELERTRKIIGRLNQNIYLGHSMKVYDQKKLETDFNQVGMLLRLTKLDISASEFKQLVQNLELREIVIRMQTARLPEIEDFVRAQIPLGSNYNKDDRRL